MRHGSFRDKVRDEGLFPVSRGTVSAVLRNPALPAVGAVTAGAFARLSREELASQPGTLPFGDQERIDVRPPHDAPSPLARMDGRYRLASPFVTELHGVTLYGDRGLVVDRDGRSPVDTALGRRDVLDRSLLVAPGSLVRAAERRVFGPSGVGGLLGPDDDGRPAEHPGTDRTFEVACSLVDAAVGGYSHWLLTALPRLQGVRHWEEATDERVTLILPRDPPAWMVESLSLLGYDDRIVEHDGGTAAVDRLVVPSVRSPEQGRSAFLKSYSFDPAYKLVSPAACRWLRSRAVGAVPGGEDAPDRLFVSREDTDRRRLRNREPVLERLEKHGFRRVVPSELSFSKQVSLFAGADVVVGPHGAGLSNLLFAEDAALIELFGAKVKPTFFLLAESRGDRYGWVRGGGKAPEDDYTVSPAAVERAVAALDGR